MSDDEFTLEDLQPGATRQEDLLGSVRAGCRIERLLGRGGMGSVYLARREADGLQVVVKFLAPEVANDPNLRARFEREWDALRKIHPHPNVVRVYDVRDEGVPVIVMEYVEGVSLLRALQQHGRMAPEQATRIALDVARGLLVVHGHGLVHRDIKPDNILVSASGLAKIVDFGLAKDLFRTALTQPGQLLGTAYYMAPEQWGEGGGALDARCDVFSLGSTLYHLLVGAPPFVGEDPYETADLIASGDYDPASERVPGIPPDLELVVAQMIEPELRFRYESMQAVVDDLDRVLRGEPVVPPSLVTNDGGARFALLPGRRFTLGSDPGCQVRLSGAGVSPRHAQLRREEAGYVLRNLKGSSGTFVEEEQLVRARALSDGERVRLGGVTLVFRDPRRHEQAAVYLQDVRREPGGGPVVQALLELRDPRVVLALLERLAPDPYADALTRHTLQALLGPQARESVLAARSQAQARGRAGLSGLLPALTGQDHGGDPGGWLGWWSQVRTTCPPQLGPPARAGLRLVVVQGLARPAQLEVGQRGLVLVGRDARCHLRTESAATARLHLTVLRLHARLAVRDEGAGLLKNGAPFASGFLDPGDVLTLGDVQLALQAESPPPPSSGSALHAVDTLAFQALVELRHPACAAALVGFLQESRAPAWQQQQAQDLFPGDPSQAGRLGQVLAGLYGARVQHARQLLPSLLGADAGEDVAGWMRLLEQRRANLPPQVGPRGWLAGTR